MRHFNIGLAIAAALAAPATAAATRPVVHKSPVHKIVVKTIVSPDGTTETVTGSAAAKALVAGCGDRHFETSAEVGVGDSKRVSRIKLCAKPGADDAAWIATLRHARNQIGGLTQLPPTSRAKLAADFDAEIGRLSAAPAATTTISIPTTAATTPVPTDPSLIAGPPK
ncbi:MAG: hypothetical protein ABIQ98_05530 [Sphingomicrobium sp.]